MHVDLLASIHYVALLVHGWSIVKLDCTYIIIHVLRKVHHLSRSVMDVSHENKN